MQQRRRATPCTADSHTQNGASNDAAGPTKAVNPIRVAGSIQRLLLHGRAWTCVGGGGFHRVHDWGGKRWNPVVFRPAEQRVVEGGNRFCLWVWRTSV